MEKTIKEYSKIILDAAWDEYEIESLLNSLRLALKIRMQSSKDQLEFTFD